MPESVLYTRSELPPPILGSDQRGTMDFEPKICFRIVPHVHAQVLIEHLLWPRAACTPDGIDNSPYPRDA